VPSPKRMREQWKVDSMELALHVGVNRQTMKRYEDGNLDVPAPVRRLLILLHEHWLEHGYKPPDEMWGPNPTED